MEQLDFRGLLIITVFQFLIMLSFFFSSESKASVKQRGWADFSLLPIMHLPRAYYC